MRSIIAFGGNLPSQHGLPVDTLEQAVRALGDLGVVFHRRSRWYNTLAWPTGSGPDYINGVAEVSFEGSCRNLLRVMQKVEKDLGRVRVSGEKYRWNPRVCDLDIICHGAMVSPGIREWRAVDAASASADRPELVLPHPLMHERAFVLGPMVELVPDWRHPVFGDTVRSMFKVLPVTERAAMRPLET